MASSGSKVSIIGGSVAFNRALRDGGGLSCQNCDLLRSVSLFHSNRALQVSGVPMVLSLLCIFLQKTRVSDVPSSVQGAGMFVQPSLRLTGGTGTDLFLDLSESQDHLQALSCYASYVAYFYSNSSYPLRCDIRLPMPFPTLSVAALTTGLGLRIQSGALRIQPGADQGALLSS